MEGLFRLMALGKPYTLAFTFDYICQMEIL